MRRIFDRRIVRCEHVGKSRYESVAQLQRAYYNAHSERIMAGVQQSFAQLMGPEDYLQNDSEIPIGPDRVLPMKGLKGPNGGTTGYQGFAYIEPPKGAQDALRTDLVDFLDSADRDAALSKPAGAGGGTVTAQSGLSKAIDGIDGNARLAKIADTLQAAEAQVAELALVVLTDGKGAEADAGIEVVYPKQFELYSAADLAQALTDLQMIAAAAGALPELEGELLDRLIGVLLPGLTDDRLDELKAETKAFLARAAAEPDPAASPGGYPAGTAQDDSVTPDSVATSPAGS